MEKDNIWHVIQACLKGQKHKDAKCQDSCFQHEDAEICVMALCDGTSDALHSDVGSAAVAEVSVNFFREHFDELYQAEFAERCDLLSQYHQDMIRYLAERAAQQTGIEILNNRTIRSAELRKFCTTVQVVALKGNRCVYFKAGNGAAVYASDLGTKILSDSSTESPTMHITMTNPLNVLTKCELKCLALEDTVYAVGLATDGVEFSDGLFCDHQILPAYGELLAQLMSSEQKDALLRSVMQTLHHSPKNIARDDIGISIAVRNLPAAAQQKQTPEALPEPAPKAIPENQGDTREPTPDTAPETPQEDENEIDAIVNVLQNPVPSPSPVEPVPEYPTAPPSDGASDASVGKPDSDPPGAEDRSRRSSGRGVLRWVCKGLAAATALAIAGGLYWGILSARTSLSRQLQELTDKLDELSSYVQELEAYTCENCDAAELSTEEQSSNNAPEPPA